ncbi:hypothetical protein K9M16_00480 [Candidatus Babeliales bacterium]|nr:hypothetical protein [Candidatus Babeliales bacterium]
MYSRRKIYLKLLFGTFITIFTAISCLSSLSLTSNNITDQNFDMVGDAKTKIAEILESEKHKPFLILAKYNFSDNGKLIKKTTKSHYDSYRKNASYEEESYTSDQNLNTGKIVEFVYRSSDKNQITEINIHNGKKSKNKIRHEFEIASVA